ncbi:hypothetical protein T265_05670 [Opisthorchis viverrini]|uniref:G-protein coupled receptors family 2 profile 2 domain-containing protein n=1 Tax=Opisthorchis viverrini TaxID=6198 RepID=A0A074ZND6_OPIVI|nr:hypothetical protein T265_05670 [Opisthorchis viverrini]KER27267.1 hypothetical protein T265_05670 [Opisthorchis viverrini]
MDCARFPEDSLCISENKTEQTPKEPSFTCPAHMRVNELPIISCLQVPPSFDFRIRMEGGQVIPDCGIPCNEFLFSDSSSRRFSRLWIGLWSCLCAASTLFTVLTFLIDMPRFQYPERPIIFLSACYLVVALTYVAGFILNDKMASAIWWVVLTITWYLAARCHWAHEAISRNAQYLHFAAWAVPAAKTIGILALGKVDGDPLSGVCFTGLTDPVILRIFLIAPLCLYLVIGTGFLFAGFVSLFKIRTIIKTGGSKTDDLEKLIMRIGVFSLLYIIPAIVVIACYFHESRMSEKWMLTWYTTEVCRMVDPYQLTDSVCPTHLRRLVETNGAARLRQVTAGQGSANSGEAILAKWSAMDKPEFELFMIKYLMTLIVGITSGIWIWSGKTLLSWQRFFSRLCRRRGCCGSHDPTVTGLAGDHRHRLVGPNTLGVHVAPSPGSVPLLPRVPPSNHPGQPFVFNQDTTTTSCWASRGAPSGVTATAPPDGSAAPVTSYGAGWIPGTKPVSSVSAQQSGFVNSMGGTNAVPTAPPSSGLGLV